MSRLEGKCFISNWTLHLTKIKVSYLVMRLIICSLLYTVLLQTYKYLRSNHDVDTSDNWKVRGGFGSFEALSHILLCLLRYFASCLRNFNCKKIGQADSVNPRRENHTIRYCVVPRASEPASGTDFSLFCISLQKRSHQYSIKPRLASTPQTMQLLGRKPAPLPAWPSAY